MKKLLLATMIGLGVMVSGCGHIDTTQVDNNVKQVQQVQENKGISLSKAIDLAKNGKFTPQRVQFEAYTTNRVFGDEPQITVVNRYENGNCHKFVKIVITEPNVIKQVAQLQEERKHNYVTTTYSVTINEITFDSFNIYAKEVE